MANSKSKHQIEITAIDKASNVVRGVESSFAKLGAFVGSAAVAGAFIEATRAAVAFEQGLAKTATLLPKANRDMTQFARGLESIRLKGLGGSLTELTDGLYETVSAGVPAGKAVAFLETASKAAKAGFTDMRTAVDGLTTVLNAYRLETEDASRVSDILFVTQNRGKTTFGEMASSLGVLLPVASSVGAKFEDMAAAISTLTIQGIPTAVAITGLRATLAAFIEKGDSSKIASMGFAGALKDLEQRTGGNQKALQDYLGRVEALNTVLALTGKNSAQFASDLQATANAAGAADDAFKAYTDNAAGGIEKLIAKFEVFKTRVGGSFAEGILSQENLDEAQESSDILVSIFEFMARRVGDSLMIWVNNLRSVLKEGRETWESWKNSLAKDPLFNSMSERGLGGSFWNGVKGSSGGGSPENIDNGFRSALGGDSAALGRMSLQGWLDQKTKEFVKSIEGMTGAAKEAEIVFQSNWGASILGSRFGPGRDVIGRLGSRGISGIGIRAGRGAGRLSGGLFDLSGDTSTSGTQSGEPNEALERFQQKVQAVSGMVLNITSSFTNAIVSGIERGTLKIKDLFSALRSAILGILADLAARLAASAILSAFFPSIGFSGFLKNLTGGLLGGGAKSFRPAPVGASPTSGFSGGVVNHNHYYIQGSLVTREQIARDVMNLGTNQARRGTNALSNYIR